jgi:hypothetical protein
VGIRGNKWKIPGRPLGDVDFQIPLKLEKAHSGDVNFQIPFNLTTFSLSFGQLALLLVNHSPLRGCSFLMPNQLTKVLRITSPF